VALLLRRLSPLVETGTGGQIKRTRGSASTQKADPGRGGSADVYGQWAQEYGSNVGTGKMGSGGGGRGHP